MTGRVRERERKRRLLVASGRTAEPSNEEERAATLARFVEQMGPMYPAEIQRIQGLYDDAWAEHSNADPEQIDLLVMLRDIRMRRAEKRRVS